MGAKGQKYHLPEDEEGDPIKILLSRFGALAQYLGDLAAIQADRARIRVRNLLVLAALGVVGFIVGVVVIITLCTYVIRGMALGLSTIFPDYPWLGDLAAGAIGLLLIGGAVALTALIVRKKLRAALVAKYEKRNAQRHTHEHNGKQIIVN